MEVQQDVVCDLSNGDIVISSPTVKNMNLTFDLDTDVVKMNQHTICVRCRSDVSLLGHQRNLKY